jgi:hypothetical protein
MKTISLILFGIIFTLQLFSTDTTYYAVLRSSIKKADSAYIPGNYLPLAYCCERIITMKPKEWLPYYYGAYAYIQLSFMEKDEEKKDMYCNRAQVYIDSAFILRPAESELNVLQALLYYALMEVNTYIRGMIYYPKANSALDEAAKNNPANPRVYFLKGKTTIYTPEFMGGGKKSALPVLEKALELYRESKPISDIDPHWGKESAEQLYETCKRDSI